MSEATILSSLAQQESQSISQNVRMGLQYRMQEGKGMLNTDRFLGLRKKDGSKYEYEIVPEEARTVRRIYREFLDGFSPAAIVKHLEKDGVLSPAGLKKWHPNTVVSILSNEKYCGDLLLQKYFVEDFLTHKLVKNTGQMPQYFVEGHHDPIVPKAVFFQVRGEMMRRKKDPSKMRYSEEKPFSGRVVCGGCGRIMYRVGRNGMYEWRFRDLDGTASEKEKKCGCRTVKEEELERVVTEALGRLLGMWEELVRIQAGIWNGDLKRLDALIEYNREAEERTMDTEESLRLTGERNRLLLERAEAANREMHVRLLLERAEIVKGVTNKTAEPADGKCEDYEEFFRLTRPETMPTPGRRGDFDQSLVTRYVEKVEVVKDGGFLVTLKGGVEIEVE